jgi:hypothetical protein
MPDLIQHPEDPRSVVAIIYFLKNRPFFVNSSGIYSAHLQYRRKGEVFQEL